MAEPTRIKLPADQAFRLPRVSYNPNALTPFADVVDVREPR